MKPSEVKLNRGIVLGFGIAYCLTCTILVGLLHMVGVIIIASSLIIGSIVGLLTYIAGRNEDNKLRTNEIINNNL